MSIDDARKTSRMGRPPVDSEEVRARIVRPTLDALDAWAADQGLPEPRRPEAVRRALADYLGAKGYLGGEGSEATIVDAEDAPAADRYADADPDEGVMVTGVGPMTLRRAVRKLADWREHHGLGLINIYRGADKRPATFDEADLGRLADLERFR